MYRFQFQTFSILLLLFIKYIFYFLLVLSFIFILKNKIILWLLLFYPSFYISFYLKKLFSHIFSFHLSFFTILFFFWYCFNFVLVGSFFCLEEYWYGVLFFNLVVVRFVLFIFTYLFRSKFIINSMTLAWYTVH
jgi:hypothetical protein